MADMDVLEMAEELAQVSASYNAEIDGVPLQQMSTNELAKLAATRGLPVSHSRTELIYALARSEQGGRSGQMHTMQEDFDADYQSEDVQGYFVGTTAIVWEDEIYTYGGLTPEGEFVTAMYRWSGRGSSFEVPTKATNPAHGLPPGRYGHTAIVSGDCLYVFGGQGQFGCLNDLWVFDFVKCTWTLIDVIGAPPSARTGHCTCLSENVMFIFGGKDVQPGQDVVVYNDLYGFDLKESEWLTIETKWKKPVGGDGCAMVSMSGILYVISPSESCMEMMVWILQLSASGPLCWTVVPRAGQLPTPRTSYAACLFGGNWIIHGGRVLLQDGVLGDTYAFHFPTAEWARLDPESDTDPRFGHSGASVDGALVLLHGTRDPSVKDSGRDTGVCIALNLETYLPFAIGEVAHSETDRFTDRFDEESTGTRAKSEPKDDRSAIEDKEAEVDTQSQLDTKILAQLNEQGIYGVKGGLLGGSLHVPQKGSHEPGDIEIVAENVKVHAHSEIITAGSTGLAELLSASPMTLALKRQPDLVDYAIGIHPLFGQLLALVIHLMYFVVVVITHTVRRMMKNQKMILVLDVKVPVLLAMLRWIYRIPRHPPMDILVDLHDAGKKYKVEGLPSYCMHRLRTEMDPTVAAGAAKVAHGVSNNSLWQASVRCAQSDWHAVSHSKGFIGLRNDDPELAKFFTLAVHDGINVELAPGAKPAQP